MSERNKKHEYDKRIKKSRSVSKRAPSPDIIKKYDRLQKKSITEEQRPKKPHLLIPPLYYANLQQNRTQGNLRMKDKKITTDAIKTEKPLNVVMKAVAVKEPNVAHEADSIKIKELQLQLEEEKIKNKEANYEYLKIQEENNRIKKASEANQSRLLGLEKKIVRLETQLEEKNTFLKNVQNQHAHLIASLGLELKDDASKKDKIKPNQSDKVETYPQDIETMKLKLALLTQAEYQARLNFKARIEDIDKRMKDLENDIKTICQNEQH